MSHTEEEVREQCQNDDVLRHYDKLPPILGCNLLRKYLAEYCAAADYLNTVDDFKQRARIRAVRDRCAFGFAESYRWKIEETGAPRQQKNNLESCPFCGGEAGSHVSDNGYCFVSCNSCGVKGPAFDPGLDIIEAIGRSKTAWNTRND